MKLCVKTPSTVPDTFGVLIKYLFYSPFLFPFPPQPRSHSFYFALSITIMPLSGHDWELTPILIHT